MTSFVTNSYHSLADCLPCVHQISIVLRRIALLACKRILGALVREQIYATELQGLLQAQTVDIEVVPQVEKRIIGK